MAEMYTNPGKYTAILEKPMFPDKSGIMHYHKDKTNLAQQYTITSMAARVSLGNKRNLRISAGVRGEKRRRRRSGSISFRTNALETLIV